MFALAGLGDEFLDVLGTKQDRVADPVVGDLSRLGHPIPPPFRPLPRQIPSLCLSHGHEGIFMFNLLEVQHGRREAATRTPRSNCIPGGKPRINVGLKVQRLALIGLLYGDDFGEKLVVNVLGEAGLPLEKEGAASIQVSQ